MTEETAHQRAKKSLFGMEEFPPGSRAHGNHGKLLMV
jgi:hypothetical protein